MEEDTGKSLHVGGATGRIHGAEYSLVDYNRAGIPLIEIVTKPITGTGERAPRDRPRLRHRAARPAPRARRQRRPDGAGLPALRRQRVAAADAAGPVRHPHRDQERQLAAQRRARRALRDLPAGGACSPPGGRVIQETRHWHEDTGVTTSGRSKKQTPRTTGTSPSPTSCRSRPTPAWVERAARPRCPSRPRSAAGAAAGGLGLHRPRDARRAQRRRRRARRGHGRGRAPPRPPPASGGSGELARRANAEGVDLASLAITPAAGRRAAARSSTTAH